MTRDAVVYLSSTEDLRAAFFTVAGRPVVFRAILAALRAGVVRVGIPAVFRGGELERLIAQTPSARSATVWLEEAAEPPTDPVLLLPGAALAPVRALSRILESPPAQVLAGSCGGRAPVVAVAPALARPLWRRLVAGHPVGEALREALGSRDVGVAPPAPWYVHVTDEAAARHAGVLLCQDLGSPVDTRFDTVFHRRLSRPLTRVAVTCGLMPNLVTLASLLVGLAAAACVWRGGLASTAAGFLLYELAVVLDHSDGEVARLTLAESTIGDWLDLLADTVVNATVVLAMGVAAERLVGGGATILGGIAAAGVLASAALVKISPLPSSATGLGGLLRGLSNRNGFYGALVAFMLTLALLPAALPVLMAAVAAGIHAFWVGGLAYRLGDRRRSDTVRPEAPGSSGTASRIRRCDAERG